jgi:hypothetical protein
LVLKGEELDITSTASNLDSNERVKLDVGINAFNRSRTLDSLVNIQKLCLSRTRKVKVGLLTLLCSGNLTIFAIFFVQVNFFFAKVKVMFVGVQG